MALKDYGYNSGGVNSPKHSNPGENASDCDILAATKGTVDNQVNVNNVPPGSHNEKGSIPSLKY